MCCNVHKLTDWLGFQKGDAETSWRKITGPPSPATRGLNPNFSRLFAQAAVLKCLASGSTEPFRKRWNR